MRINYMGILKPLCGFFVTCSVPNTLPLQQVDLLFCTPPPADRGAVAVVQARRFFGFHSSVAFCQLREVTLWPTS